VRSDHAPNDRLTVAELRARDVGSVIYDLPTLDDRFGRRLSCTPTMLFYILQHCIYCRK